MGKSRFIPVLLAKLRLNEGKNEQAMSTSYANAHGFRIKLQSTIGEQGIHFLLHEIVMQIGLVCVVTLMCLRRFDTLSCQSRECSRFGAKNVD